MSGYGLSVASGRIAASELDYVWTPKARLAGRPGVILLHGAGNPAGYADPVAQPAGTRLAAFLADAGFYCIAGAMAGDSWGNDTGLARVVSAVALAEAATGITGCYLVGGSMGFGLGLRYAQANRAKVRAMQGLIPLVDPTALTGAAATSCASAWSVASVAVLPARAQFSSSANRTTVSGLPMRLHYASDDTTVAPATVTSFATATGATAVNVGALGHTDAAIAAVDPAGVRDFLLAN